MPTLTCFSFSCFFKCLFSLLVPLSPYISCYFVLLFHSHFHCATCLAPSQAQSDLFVSLCILSSYPCICFVPSIEAFSCNFQFYICPLSVCLAPQIICQPIIYLAACFEPSLPLLCNAPLSCTFVESNVLKFCLASLPNPITCAFDLCLCDLSCTFESYV